MDSQGATVPELIEWFISIRQERSKLVAENNNETNADLVGCSTAAMHAVMKKILLLTQGTALATTARSKPFFTVGTTGFPAAIVQEKNKSTSIGEPDPFHEIDLLARQFHEKLLRLPHTAQPSGATFRWSDTTSSFMGPIVPVMATTIRARTPLGSFRVIMMANTKFLADTTAIISSMLDRDSRKNLALTSTAMNNLVHRKINLERPAAQDQELSSKKKPKKTKKAKMSWTLVPEDQKRSKKARETISEAEDQAEGSIA